MSHLFGKWPVRLWTAYNHQLNKHPIHTKAATSCVAFALGDVLAQHLTKERHRSFDWSRTLRMAAFGGVIAGTRYLDTNTASCTPTLPPPTNDCPGPVGHHWYRFLDTNVGVANPTAPRVIATKVGLDQFVFAPLSTFMFYAYLCSAEGRPSTYG